MKKLIVLAAIYLALFVGCKKASTAFTPSCSGTAKSFATDVKPIFQSSCVQCHGNFSTYAQISSDKANIRSKIIDGSMPQSSSLSTDQKNKIICWIDAGAPNN
ncbi:MAG: hypothetical protein WCH34_15700 [Bacteroidota bacterium]